MSANFDLLFAIYLLFVLNFVLAIEEVRQYLQKLAAFEFLEKKRRILQD